MFQISTLRGRQHRSGNVHAVSTQRASAYRLILGRDPEDKSVVSCTDDDSLSKIAAEFLSSLEFSTSRLPSLLSGEGKHQLLEEDREFALAAFPLSMRSRESLQAATDVDAALRIILTDEPVRAWIAEVAPATAVRLKESRLRFGALFDPEWYTSQAGEEAIRDPFEHYRTIGWHRRLDPHPLFSVSWYLDVHPDVAEAGIEPLSHYVECGFAQDLEFHPLFDASSYYERYPQLRGYSGDALQHYLVSGGAADDFHPHPLLESAWYRESYPDSIGTPMLEHYLRHARTTAPNRYFDVVWYIENNLQGFPETLSPLQHYVECWMPSRPKARQWQPQPHPLFDGVYYYLSNPDIQSHFREPLQHYLGQGASEGRRPNPFFDPAYYSRSHLTGGDSDPLIHYSNTGMLNGLRPNPYFEPHWYSETYDVPLAQVLVHFITIGREAGLWPHPLWNEQRYIQSNPDVATQLQRRVIGSGYEHFVRIGALDAEAGRHRLIYIEWGEHVFNFDRAAYLADNPDVQAAVAEGRVDSCIEHLYTIGYKEGLAGLRAIYAPRHRVRLLRDKKVEVAAESARPGRYLCIFAHYDRDGLIDEYVIAYLRALRACTVDIVFVSAVRDEAELCKVEPYCTRVLVKNDAGRDFGSWWIALRTLGVRCGAEYERVIFANDSIYCPVRPLAPVFQDMDLKGFNLFGLSDSHELGSHHVQSFFLAFDRKAQETIFPKFVDAFDRNYVLTKWGQIAEYELGLTKLARDAGLSIGTFVSIDDLREEVLRDTSLTKWADLVRPGLGNINPTHQLWDLIIAHCGFPGLKLELLRDNPLHVQGLEAMPSLVVDGEVQPRAIYRHQARSKEVSKVKVRPIPAADAPVVLLREKIDGPERERGQRIVLFAHYDPHGIIDPHVVYQLAALRDLHFDIVLITSTDQHKELAKVRELTRAILIKNEAGRDFGSWAIALQTLAHELDGYESVVWMNDSTYFPLFDVSQMVAQMSSRHDFWGVVDSENVTWHIMSWFWSFNRKIIDDGWFDWYLREYNSSYSKWAQIHNYEMRIPGLLRRSGYDAGAYLTSSSVSEAIQARGASHPRYLQALDGRFNMMHDFWREVVEDLRCPAMKVELLRDNPLGLDLTGVLDVVGSSTTYDPVLIRSHMQRLKTGHLPSPAWAELGRVSKQAQ